MSLAEARTELAAVLSTVEGVKGHRYRPITLPTGTAYPLLESLAEPMGDAFVATWRVVVVLPSDEVRAAEWFEAHYEPIAEALSGFGNVERIEFDLFDTEAGEPEVMLITVRREA